MESTPARDAVIQQRFMQPGDKTEQDVWRRVADHWSDSPEEADEFFNMMNERRGFPNTPAIANAGKPLNMGSACFVLPIGDSLEDIMQTAKDAAVVQKSGGGTGFSFGALRAKGSPVESTGREAPGPVSFLKMYSQIFAHVTQAGLRPGANMGILPVDHPDIMEFITCKGDNYEITNFNISVGITDKFMGKVVDGDPSALIIWEAICQGAWKNGEPGVVFLDTMNKTRLHDEEFEATNPCGEVPLLPYEACVLGSVNLAAFATTGSFDFSAFAGTVHTMTRMLDNIVDKQSYPLPIIEETHKRYRKIGVGVMGFADMLIKLGVIYGSEASVAMADVIADILMQESRAESGRGPKPLPSSQLFQDIARRNLCTTVIAPTGTISRLAGCSFGIEPIFMANYKSYILGGAYEECHPLQDHEHFVTLKDVPPTAHVDIQAAFQKHVDQAVSKTVNLPNSATVEQVKELYMRAWQSGCKGTTVLRADSREDVVIEDCASGVCAL